MFGVGIFEILVVLVVAVIFLGPDKLPQAIVDVTKFFRAIKKTINEAKDTFDKEVQISELKKEALGYKKLFEENLNATKSEVDTITKDFKELSNLSLNNPTNAPIPTHPQKSAESRALESLNFQSAQLDADIGITHSTQDSITSTSDCVALDSPQTTQSTHTSESMDSPKGA
ncbi:twin-arginine translocase subunit TatB [Helicobacter sp. TUL]|uniref:Sec-independent protein translocase protein TatB n=1 Tax=Helicobacter sp. TUL TaxID=1848928 RepID=UPI000BAC0EEF|nr:Sec-independent protein translocase protein TatB [Helicobacter sp. TUL]PAV00920.1 twin-arginine translocase subunit TatB [Helicobacter sp. TUL]